MTAAGRVTKSENDRPLRTNLGKLGIIECLKFLCWHMAREAQCRPEEEWSRDLSSDSSCRGEKLSNRN